MDVRIAAVDENGNQLTDASGNPLFLPFSPGGAARVQANSIPATDGGQSESVSISGTSAQSSAITTDTASIYSTVDCFMRHGSNPTALADDTDDFIPANNKLRISGITSGNKLAFITAGASGKVYITPGG